MLLSDQESYARNVRQIMLFRALTNSSVAQYPSNNQVSALLSGLSVFGSVAPPDLLRLQTPFLVMNCRRLAAALEHQREGVDLAISNLLLSAFDAYVSVLPQRLVFPVRVQGPIVLPTIGIRFGDATEETRSVEKLSESVVAFTTDQRRVEVNLKSVPRSLGIHSHSFRRLQQVRAFAAPAPLIFEDTYIDQLAHDAESLNSVCTQADEALDLLDSSGSACFGPVEQLLRWIVPLKFTDPQVHRSFTSPLLCGVVFVSPNTNTLGMAEAIVHEIAHSELNMLMEVEELFDLSQEPVFYSPWRPDPRPISGLFHALYVFARVLQFLDAIGTVCPSERDTSLDRGRLIAHRLNVGIAQIPAAALEARARRLQSDIQSISQDYLERRCPLDQTPPKQVIQHLNDWISRNPALSPNGAERLLSSGANADA